MREENKKMIVPSREKRLAEIGNPKTPRMGSITPVRVELPDVDDLLGKISQAVTESEVSKPICNAGCPCEPCRRGNCNNCNYSPPPINRSWGPQLW